MDFSKRTASACLKQPCVPALTIFGMTDFWNNIQVLFFSSSRTKNYDIDQIKHHQL